MLPNLVDYEGECRAFSWDAARAALQGLPGGGLNMGFEAVDRHAAGPLKDRTALRFVSRSAAPLDLSFGELARRTNRFAMCWASLASARAIACSCSPGAFPNSMSRFSAH